MLKKKEVLRLLIFLLVINSFVIIGWFSSFTGKAVYERIEANVTRAIDGDTFETYDFKVRMLGINTPEKNRLGYQEAKNFMDGFTGKQVELEIAGDDKYGRKLAYVFYNKKLVNKEILSLGLASLYYYDKDNYYNEMRKAEEKAREQGIGIWQKSKNYGCLKIVSFNYQENERCKNQEQLTLSNNCDKINANLKDDATHIFPVEVDKHQELAMNFSCVWNDDGDSLYVYDDEGLILFYRYS